MKLFTPSEAKAILEQELAQRKAEIGRETQGFLESLSTMGQNLLKEINGFPNPQQAWEIWKNGFQKGSREEFFEQIEKIDQVGYTARGNLGETIALRDGELDPILENLCLLEAKEDILAQLDPLLGDKLPEEIHNSQAEEFVQKWLGRAIEAQELQLEGILEDLEKEPLPEQPLPEGIPNLRFGIEIEGFLLTQEPWETQRSYLEKILTEALPETWAVTRDWSIKPPLRTKNKDNVGIEIIAPILKGEEGMQQAALALKTLRAAGFQSNRTCGLHTHTEVGRELHTLKEIVLTYLEEEDKFTSHLPAHRQKNPTCGSNRTSIEIKAKARGTTPKALILACKTPKELYQATQRDKHCGLNIEPACTPSKPPTAEFRTAESVIQPEGLLSVRHALKFTERCLTKTKQKRLAPELVPA